MKMELGKDSAAGKEGEHDAECPNGIDEEHEEREVTGNNRDKQESALVLACRSKR